MPNDSTILTAAFKLPPEEAIKLFEQKGYKISFDWHDMKREAHAKAFTVAGITSLDVLADIRGALDNALKTGKSLGSFQKELIPLLEKKGWWGKKTITRPDGSQKEVDLSAPWRLKTIYQTNMRTSFMAGKYKGLKDASDVMPYWRYVAVMDGRTRDEHRALHNKILPHDDPFWNRYYPPNGWGCRCTVTGVTKRQLAREGLKLGDGKALENQIMPFVPDGWDYNPGIAAVEHLQAIKREKEAKFSELKAPKPIVKEQETNTSQLVDLQPTQIVDQTPSKLVDQMPPRLIETIDSADEKAVRETLEKHEKEIVKQKNETAVIITKSGKVYRVDGVNDRVYPEVLGDELEGSVMSHNHPASETEYSFSKDDFDLFELYKLAVLRGVDEEFIYELTRNSKQVDGVEDLERMDAKDIELKSFSHLRAVRLATVRGLGYRRIRNG